MKVDSSVKNGVKLHFVFIYIYRERKSKDRHSIHAELRYTHA